MLEIAEELVPPHTKAPKMMSIWAQELPTKLEEAASRFDSMTNCLHRHLLLENEGARRLGKP